MPGSFMNVHSEILEYPNGQRDCRVTFTSQDGLIAAGVRMDAASLRNVAAAMVSIADKLDSPIVLPAETLRCPACAGLVREYDEKPELVRGEWMHRRWDGGAHMLRCMLPRKNGGE